MKNTKEKLVMVISSSVGGGAQKMLADMAVNLEYWFDILVICPDGYLSNLIEDRKLQLVKTKVNPIYLPKIKRIIHKWSDGKKVMINAYLFGTAFYMVLVFPKNEQYSVFSLLLNPIIRDNLSGIRKILYKIIAKLIGKKSWNIGVGSPELEKEVVKLCNRNPFYLENRVPNQALYRERIYGNEKDKPLKVCFVGRMEQQKRPDIFLNTAKITHDRGHNIEYFMAGEGCLLDSVKDYISKNNLKDVVKLVGFIEDLYSFLYDMDVLLLTSEFENTPLIIPNAMNAGLVVVAGNVTGVPHLIKNWIDGVIVDIFTPNSFADALINLENDQQIYQILSKNAYEKAITDFSYQLFVNKYKKALLSKSL